MDNKISFIGGFLFTTLSTMTTAGVVKTAVFGLVGGFFGILGKEVYYYVRDEVKAKLNKNQ